VSSVEYTDKSKQWLAGLQGDVDVAVGATGEFLAQTIQDQMPGAGAAVIEGTGGGTGVKGKYIPSNPGSPPGVRTNRLKGSITSNKTGKKMQRAVGTNVGYAFPLEMGTTKMPRRPFMRPGLDAAKKPMLRVFINTLKQRRSK
jgi:HK97 gp10 family phage protein